MRILDGEIVGKRVEAVCGSQLQQPHQNPLGEEVLRKNHNHFGVLVECVLFEDPVPLQAELDVPKRPEGVSRGKFILPLHLVALGSAPELYEGSDELTLVALGADMCQADD